MKLLNCSKDFWRKKTSPFCTLKATTEPLRFLKAFQSFEALILEGVAHFWSMKPILRGGPTRPQFRELRFLRPVEYKKKKKRKVRVLQLVITQLALMLSTKRYSER